MIGNGPRPYGFVVLDALCEIGPPENCEQKCCTAVVVQWHGEAQIDEEGQCETIHAGESFQVVLS